MRDVAAYFAEFYFYFDLGQEMWLVGNASLLTIAVQLHLKIIAQWLEVNSLAHRQYNVLHFFHLEKPSSRRACRFNHCRQYTFYEHFTLLICAMTELLAAALNK